MILGTVIPTCQLDFFSPKYTFSWCPIQFLRVKCLACFHSVSIKGSFLTHKGSFVIACYFMV